MMTFRSGACSSCPPARSVSGIWRWPPAKLERCICSIATILGGFTPGGPDKVLDDKDNRALLVRAVLFHRSGRGRAGRKQRLQRLYSHRRRDPRTNRGLEGSDLAHGCIRPGRRGVAGRQRPGSRNFYGGFLERHNGRDHGHMGDRTTKQPDYLSRHSLCLRGGAFGWHAAVAVFLAGGIMAQLAGQRQYRAGRGEWKGLCGEQQAADDFRPRRAYVCGARGRRGRAGGGHYP